MPRKDPCEQGYGLLAVLYAYCNHGLANCRSARGMDCNDRHQQTGVVSGCWKWSHVVVRAEAVLIVSFRHPGDRGRRATAKKEWQIDPCGVWIFHTSKLKALDKSMAVLTAVEGTPGKSTVSFCPVKQLASHSCALAGPYAHGGRSRAEIGGCLETGCSGVSKQLCSTRTRTRLKELGHPAFDT